MNRRLSARAQTMIGVVVVSLALVIGYLLVVGPWLDLRDAADWAETSCRITTSDVVSSTTRDRRHRPLTQYELVLAYDYQAGERTQHGTAIDFEARGPTTEADDVHALQKRYPVGATLACWYDPADPDRAVLERGSWWPGGAGLVPFVMLAIGGAIMAHGIARRRRAPAA